MSFDLQKILESKRAFHRKLADLRIIEKLRMLDALQERELAIRGTKEIAASVFREKPPGSNHDRLK